MYYDLLFELSCLGTRYISMEHGHGKRRKDFSIPDLIKELLRTITLLLSAAVFITVENECYLCKENECYPSV